MFEAISTIGDGVHGVTRASVGDATIRGGELKVDALATQSAKTDLITAAVGLVGAGADANSTATIDADTKAYLGDVDVIVARTVEVNSASDGTAVAPIGMGGGSLVVTAVIGSATSTVKGDTKAYIGNGAEVMVVLEMTDHSRVDHAKKWHGYVGQDHWRSYAPDFFIIGFDGP